MTARDIVVGLDDSPASVAALRWATRQALLTGDRMRVVQVWTSPTSELVDVADMHGSAVREAHLQDTRARATRTVTQTLSSLDVEPTWSLEIMDGAPGPALVHSSRSARMLVLGTREHVGWRRAITGSVSHYCVSHAKCPVVVVPPAQTGEPAMSAPAMFSPGPLL
jgi:nucleotide-binding universal stress UspA family protein